MSLNRHISVRDDDAEYQLDQFYLRQHQEFIFDLGLKYLSVFVNPILEDDTPVDYKDLQAASIPDGLIKVAHDLKQQGFESISGFHDLEKSFADRPASTERFSIMFDDACLEAAVTGHEVSSQNIGHIRAPKIWHKINQYQWQGCNIKLVFKPLEIDADQHIVDNIGELFVEWGLDYFCAEARKEFCLKLKALQEASKLAFCIYDIAPLWSEDNLQELSISEEIKFLGDLQKAVRGLVDVRLAHRHEATVKDMEKSAFLAWSVGLISYHPFRENSHWDSAISFQDDDVEDKSSIPNTRLKERA